MIAQLLRGGILRSANIVVAVALAFWSMPILIKGLGDHDYGLMSLVYAIVGIVMLGDLGFNRAFSQSLSAAYGSRNQSEIQRAVSVGLAVNLGLTVLVLLSVTMLSLLNSWWAESLGTPLIDIDPSDSNLFVQVLLIIGLTSAIQFPTRVAGGILYIVIRHDLLTIGSMVESLVRVLLSVWLIRHGYGIIPVVLLALVTNLCEYIWEFVCAKRVFPTIRFNLDAYDHEYTKDLFRYSFVAFASDSLRVMKTQILPILATSLVSINAVVFMTVAQRVIAYTVLFVESWSVMLNTLFGQFHGRTQASSGTERSKNDMQLRNLLTHGTTLLVIGVEYILLCLILYGDAFIEAWLGSKYQSSARLMILLAIPTAVECIVFLGKSYLYGIARHHGLVVLHGIELALMLALAIPLGIQYGLEGIAWAVVIAVTPIELIGVPYWVSKVSGLSIWTLYGEPIETALRFQGVAALAWILVHSFVESTFVSLLALNTAQFVVFLPFFFFLTPYEIRTKIRNRIRSKR